MENTIDQKSGEHPTLHTLTVALKNNKQRSSLSLPNLSVHKKFIPTQSYLFLRAHAL